MDWMLWPAIIAGGPAQPPRDTVDYRQAQMQIDIWATEDEIFGRLTPTLQRLSDSLLGLVWVAGR